MRLVVLLTSLLVVSMAVAQADAIGQDSIALPEPATLGLVGIGAVALMLSTWRNKK